MATIDLNKVYDEYAWRMKPSRTKFNDIMWELIQGGVSVTTNRVVVVPHGFILKPSLPEGTWAETTYVATMTHQLGRAEIEFELRGFEVDGVNHHCVFADLKLKVEWEGDIYEGSFVGNWEWDVHSDFLRTWERVYWHICNVALLSSAQTIFEGNQVPT